MDIFNSKALAEASQALNESTRENGRLQGELSICRLVIRDMDKLIFEISQMTAWESMRPKFAELLKGTEHRRQAESERISNIINRELARTNI
jgi:hypothetical protein